MASKLQKQRPGLSVRLLLSSQAPKASPKKLLFPLKGVPIDPRPSLGEAGGGGGPLRRPESWGKLRKVRRRQGAARALSKAQPPSRASFPALRALPLIDTLYIYPTTQVMYHRPTPSSPPKKKEEKKDLPSQGA